MHGDPVDFPLTAKCDLEAAKRFLRKILKDQPLLSPNKIGTDGASTSPLAIKTSVDSRLLHPDPVHYVTKHLQQGIKSDHFRVKKNMAKDRRFPILQYRAANDCWFRGDAMAEERLWFYRGLDCQRPERPTCAPLPTYKG